MDSLVVELNEQNFCYLTNKQKFLDHFGLSSLKDLPGLKELRAAGLLESRPPPGTSLKEEEFSENNGDSNEADFFEDDD